MLICYRTTCEIRFQEYLPHIFYRMKVIEYGKQNEKTIVLLHGGGLSWWNYRSEAELLCDRFHVVLPFLDGHGDSDAEFVSIEKNADRIIALIDSRFKGGVFLIGGLSLGGQILLEILSKRADICSYAIIESAAVIPSPMTNVLIKPSFATGYGLMKKKWFAKKQFQYLHIRDELFEDYFRDTPKVSKRSMIAFLKASTDYKAKPGLKKSRAKVRIVVGGKEKQNMLRSAKRIREMIPDSSLEIKDGLYHGEYSLNQPVEYAAELLRFCGMEDQRNARTAGYFYSPQGVYRTADGSLKKGQYPSGNGR